MAKRKKERLNRFAKILKKHDERESKIESKVVKYGRKHLGAVFRKMNGLGFNHWPDRLVFMRKCPALLIEFKRKGKEPTEMQALLHKELRAMGYEVWVEDDAEVCIRKLNAWFVMHQGKPK